jgi:hypothetical protein
MKRAIVSGLETACVKTHWITNHRPWLWAFRNCQLSDLSMWLDRHWHTGHWDYEQR